MTQICHNCGARSDVPSRYCTSCGTQLIGREQATPTEQIDTPLTHEPPPPHDTGGRNRRLIAAVVCAAIAGGVIAALLVSSRGKDDTAAVTAAHSSPVQTTAQQARTVVTTVQASPSSQPAPGTSSVTSATTTPTAQTIAPARTQTSATTPATAAGASIDRVVYEHWADIEAGRYDEAFAALARGTQSRGAWIDAHKRDAPTTARISLGPPALTSSTTATVPVLVLHTEAPSGCNDWTGHYEMVKLGGAWKIDKAKISNSRC